MKLEQVLAEVNYEVLQGSLDKEVADIAYDSRKVKKDVMFVAIEGTVVDGHKFIDSAVAQGAGVVVVEKRVEVADKDVTVVLVKNGRVALSLMSAAYFGYPAKKMITVGITGTKGKSTTETMVRDIIEKSGKTVGIIGTIGAFMKGKAIVTENTTPESYELQKLFAMMESRWTVSPVLNLITAYLPTFLPITSDRASTKISQNIFPVRQNCLNIAKSEL